jgi:hypothetical protein
MYGSLRIYITKGINVFVFVDLGGRDITLDYLTEQAIHCAELVDPPNAALEEDAEKVDKPHEGDTNKDKNDSEDNANDVLLCKAAAYAVDHPNDSDRGNAENELDNLGKIVNCLDDRIHFYTSFLFWIIKVYHNIDKKSTVY